MDLTLVCNKYYMLAIIFLIPYRIHICAQSYVAIDSLIVEDADQSQYGFFVHPGETVRLPFKYLTFSLPSACTFETSSCGFARSKAVIKVSFYFNNPSPL